MDVPQSAFPMNCWWVAATPEEVVRKPLSRRLLGRPVVLFRTTNGAVNALDDRCPHRGAPLSLGRLLGDEIACPYHGFRYDTAGVCTHIPTQAHIPASLQVRHYPVCEHGPFVWIWMGEPGRADQAQLPQITWPADSYAMRFGSYVVKECNYVSVQENYMDLAHILFLHESAQKDWLLHGDTPQLLQSSTTVEETSGALIRTTKQSGVQPVPLDARTLGIGAGQTINHFHKATFLPPGCFFQEEVNEISAAPVGTRQHYGYRAVHCTTPITADSCHWWRAYAYDFGHEALEDYQARWAGILKEDYDLLESIQSAIRANGDNTNTPETLVLADRTAAAVRRMVRELAEAEATP